MQLSNTLKKAAARFVARCAEVGQHGIDILENSTEEIMHGLTRGEGVKLYQATKAPVRLEENYLYASRRFRPGALAATDYRFFQNAIGQAGTADGFGEAATPVTLSDLENNMDVGGQIAQGKNFVFKQIGISFNSEILTSDLEQLMDAGALRYTKQGDQYQLRHGPVRLWPGSTGVSGFAATTVAATGIQAAHNGVADTRAARQLKVARVIREKESFSYVYSVPRATRGDGATAWAINGGLASGVAGTPGCIMTVWLWGGQFDTIPG